MTDDLWFDGQRQPNTLYVASISRGKDSTAMLRAIQLMKWPLDIICSVDIWFDDETPAELPPMVAFKNDYDRKVLDAFGIPVTRLCATKRERETYCKLFYEQIESRHYGLHIRGFPKNTRAWCKLLKDQTDGRYKFLSDTNVLRHLLSTDYTETKENCDTAEDGRRKLPNLRFSTNQRNLVSIESQTISTTGFQNQRNTVGVQENPKRPLKKPLSEGRNINIVHYIGIANDEPMRIQRHMNASDKVLPLVQIGWDEDLCGLEATYMNMLAPTYTDGQMRDGCWFCHNQGVDQLRKLRKNYPDLWEKLMKLDADSPVTFHADGHTVHDFDRRFEAEEHEQVPIDRRFRWKMLDPWQQDKRESTSDWLDRLLREEVNI